MNTSDILIIGAGVIGLSIARELRKRGVGGVRVLDKGTAGQEASWAAAGILAPQVEANEADDFFRLCYESNRMYRRFADELFAETGIDIELDQAGTLYLGFDEEDEAEIERRFEWQTRHGLNVRRLSRAEVLEIEPGLSTDMIGGLLFPDDGPVENRRLVDALAAYAKLNGIEITEDTQVERILIENGRAISALACGVTFQADVVIIAAGAWTSLIQAETSRPLPTVKPIRGQMLCYRPAATLCRHVVYSRRGYLVPRADGRLLAGATAEDVGFDKATTRSGTESLKQAAAEIIPAITNLPIADQWAGLRPYAGDGRPFIGRVPDIDGLYLATGHFRNGILLAPITGKMIADEICGIGHDAYLDTFGVR